MQGSTGESFNPDAFLSRHGSPDDTTQQSEFNPDAFISKMEGGGQMPSIQTQYKSPVDAYTPESMRFFSGIKGIDNLFTPEQKKAFDDLDNVLPSDESRESVRARVISQKFAETQLPGLPPSYLAENWDAVKSGFMQKFNESKKNVTDDEFYNCLLYTSPSPRDRQKSRMPSSA